MTDPCEGCETYDPEKLHSYCNYMRKRTPSCPCQECILKMMCTKDCDELIYWVDKWNMWFREKKRKGLPYD